MHNLMCILRDFCHLLCNSVVFVGSVTYNSKVALSEFIPLAMSMTLKSIEKSLNVFIAMVIDSSKFLQQSDHKVNST